MLDSKGRESDNWTTTVTGGFMEGRCPDATNNPTFIKLPSAYVKDAAGMELTFIEQPPPPH